MRNCTIRRFIFLLFLLPALSFAQSAHKTKRDSLHTYHNAIDTLYIRKYPERFILTLSQSYRQYDVRFDQTMTEDTAHWGFPQWIADANVSSGASIDFDKISFSFGLKTIPATTDVIQKKGNTTYKSFNFSFSANRFRVESGYRDYHGFYDNKTPTYDTSFHTTGIYAKNPSMDVRSLHVKTIFIFNKRRFSYNAAFFNTERQLKSSESLLLVSNIYSYRMGADTSLIPKASQPFYKQFSDLNVFNASGISIGPGYSGTLVLWKTLYFNATFSTLFDFQHRYYNTFSKSYEDQYWHVGFAGDSRFAIGLNGKRLFYSITFRMDVNSYLGDGIRINPRYKSVDFNLGYRFHVKQRPWIVRMKQSKLYQMM
ncbi:MAG TPA: DUF4421 family protein [Bacteroidia bacterium]|nr:DUF4421 family protein [Bacteroidia bacterium]